MGKFLTLDRRMLRVFVLKCLTLYHSIGGTKYNLWAEQTVARRKTKFLKKVTNSSNILYRRFAADAAKELATL